ncbi:unnamed protein product, partial [Symbiodinium pilosum]
SGLWPGDVDSWSSLLLNLSKLGTQGTALWARALSCVEALTGTGLATSPVSSYVLNICARNSAWQEALAFFNSSEDASTLAFNAALAACQAGRKYELARGFFRRMCALGLANTASFNSLLGDRQRDIEAGDCEIGNITLGFSDFAEVYDATIAKHGISATDLAGIQIYRALLQWGRQDRTKPPSRVRAPLETLSPVRNRGLEHFGSATEPTTAASCDWRFNPPAEPAEPVTGHHQNVLRATHAGSPTSGTSAGPTACPQTRPCRTQPESNHQVPQVVEPCTAQASLTATAEPVALALAPQGGTQTGRSESPGRDLVDLLPTASALVSTSMLPFSAPTQATLETRSDLAELVVLADAFAYRKNLAWATGAWQQAVHHELAMRKDLQRKQALRRWRLQTMSAMSCRALRLQQQANLRRRQLQSGLSKWRLCLAARRRFREVCSKLHVQQRQRCLTSTYGCWVVVVQTAQQLLTQARDQARQRLLQVCWEALREHTQQRQLMNLYRSWADVHWLRSRLGAAWQATGAFGLRPPRFVTARSVLRSAEAWVQWLRKRGGGHAQCPAAAGRLALAASSCCCALRAESEAKRAPRRAQRRRRRMVRGWWAPATELFYGPALFEVHPHHVKAVQHTVLPGFVSALMQKMLADWQMQAQATCGFTRRVNMNTLRRHLKGWQVQAEQRQRCRACQQSVVASRVARARSHALHSWRARTQEKVRHRHRARDFAAACWYRHCRRAFLAWQTAWKWEAAVARAQHSAGQRLVCEVFKVWLGHWHYEHQELVLLRLSGLFLRKCSLKRGLRQLHLNVRLEARQRVVLEVEAHVREGLLRKQRHLQEATFAGWARHAESCRLMKLQRAACELLLTHAPFDIHPHHMQVMRPQVLATFTHALLKKMVAVWVLEVLEIRSILRDTATRFSRRWLLAWKAAAAKRRKLRSLQQAVRAFRSRRACRRALLQWRWRWAKQALVFQRARDLSAASYQRRRRRALDAWLMARHC